MKESVVPQLRQNYVSSSETRNSSVKVGKKIRFALPSRISQEAKRIYALMKLTHSLTPWLISSKV